MCDGGGRGHEVMCATRLSRPAGMRNEQRVYAKLSTAKSVINEALRAGLEAMQRIPQQRTTGEPVSYTDPVDLGPPARADLLPSELLALADEEHDIERLDVPR